MGACLGSQDSQTKITLKHLIMRLKTSIPLEKGKLERKLQKDETSLIQDFHKQKNLRNKPIQECLIEQVVFMKNMITLWGVTENCCTKVIDYYSVLQDPNNVNHIKNQIQILLFFKSIIKNGDLEEIYKTIIRRYKINQPIMVENQIANFHKHSNSPNEKMRNQYIMNLCMNNQIQLAKVNEAGHNFRYGI